MAEVNFCKACQHLRGYTLVTYFFNFFKHLKCYAVVKVKPVVEISLNDKRRGNLEYMQRCDVRAYAYGYIFQSTLVTRTWNMASGFFGFIFSVTCPLYAGSPRKNVGMAGVNRYFDPSSFKNKVRSSKLTVEFVGENCPWLAVQIIHFKLVHAFCGMRLLVSKSAQITLVFVFFRVKNNSLPILKLPVSQLLWWLMIDTLHNGFGKATMSWFFLRGPKSYILCIKS